MKSGYPMRIQRLGIGFALVLALLLRAVYLAEIAPTPEFSHPGLDSAYHIYWARGMASGDWTDFEGREDPQLYRFPYYRPPGYAFFLALVFRFCGYEPIWPRILQFIIGLGSVLLAFRLGRRCFDGLTALLAALGMAVYWIFIYYEGELVGVVWSVLLLLLFAELLARSAVRGTFFRYLPAGLALGLLVLFRSNALVLLPAGAAWAAWPIRRGGWRRLASAAGGLLLGTVIAIAPVTIRNFAVSGELVPLAVNAGISFGVANNELSDGTSHYIPGIGNIGSPYDWPRIVRKLELDLGRPLSHNEASNYLTRQAFRFALESPGRFLALTGRKALLFWGPREIRNLREVHFARLDSPLLRNLPGNFPLVLSLAILGGIMVLAFPGLRPAGVSPGERRWGSLIVLLVLAYFFSMLPFAAGARYRVPVIPFLIILGARAVRGILGLLSARRRPAVLAAISGTAALYLLCSRNYTGFKPSPEKWHYDRGLSLLRADRWDEAVAEFDRALAVQPDFASVYTNRGIALQKSGRPAAAAESYRRALELEPGSLPALKNLADLFLEEGKAEEAIAAYRRALESGPEYTAVAVDLARALAREGRGEEAAEVYRGISRSRPESLSARVGLGNLLLEAGDPAGAREEYRAALEIHPRSVLARYNLANTLIEEGRIEEGIAEYRLVLRTDPRHRDTLNNLGAQLAARGELGEALEHFEAAIRSDPADPAGYFNRGVALIRLGRPGEAVADLEKTLELSPDYEPARRALATMRPGARR